jgi:opacity protein-like surface antigen
MSRFRRLQLAAIAAIVLGATAAPAHAVDAGPYATALVGLANQSDQALALSGAGAPQERTVSLDSGGLAGAALGWQFANGWRLEGEFAYQSVDSGNPGFAPPGPQGEGNYASTSVALNALYEFDLFGSPRARTYVGAGLVRLTEVDIDFEAGGSERSYSGSDNGVQLLFGARYALGERTFVDAGVRWLRASSLTLDGEGSTAGTIRADYEPWAVTVGVGWRF